MMPYVDVIIVNWNSGEQLRECLQSLARARSERHSVNRIVVIDNASTDCSIECIEEELNAQIVRNTRNVGFAAACNQGAAGSIADALLFLNPDTRVRVDTIDKAMTFLMANSRVGICGVALEDANARVTRTACRLPVAADLVTKALGLDKLSRGLIRSYPMEEWPHDENLRVGHVIGAFYLVRRDLFVALGGFDERFFVYLEDLDFSARAAAARRETWFLADARAYHKGGGTSERVRATRLFCALRSRLQYAHKHFGAFGTACVWLATLVVEPVIRLWLAAVHADTAALRDTGAAYWRLWTAVLGGSLGSGRQ